jgi:2-polyprenyl-6-methoxyphenol hydroxylase-like FAD-dependent oxidoreductase
VRIACVGAGPAGLYLSLLIKLRDPGHEVTVFERNKYGSAPGWGVTFGAELLQELYRYDPKSAHEVRQAAVCWREQIIYFRGEQVPYLDGEIYNISRRRMLEILSARAQELGVRLEYGHEVFSLSELPEADLTVAADGVNSRIRQMAGNFQTRAEPGRNKYIWLGTDKSFAEFSFIFVPTSSGWIWAYAYGLDAESSTFIVECAPETWSGLGFDIMPIDEALPILEKLFIDQLAGHRLIGRLPEGGEARWLSFKMIRNNCWNSGRIVLIGDSAHTAHFSIGAGTTLAIGDAIVLADKLQRGDMESAIRSYERQRKADLLQILTEARCSARWFENLPRYIDLKPKQFGPLLYSRRSPLLTLLPPIVSYTLLQTTARIGVLDRFRGRIGSTARTIYGRRGA